MQRPVGLTVNISHLLDDRILNVYSHFYCFFCFVFFVLLKNVSYLLLRCYIYQLCIYSLVLSHDYVSEILQNTMQLVKISFISLNLHVNINSFDHFASPASVQFCFDYVPSGPSPAHC